MTGSSGLYMLGSVINIVLVVYLGILLARVVLS